MKYQEFLNKVRHIDTQLAKWIMRHFYFMFFQIALFIIFLFWFVNMFNVLDASAQIPERGVLERLLYTQSINITIIVFIMLMNSFWLLYMFNALQRSLSVLKDINFHISRLRFRNK